jgi:hypothetical protein
MIHEREFKLLTADGKMIDTILRGDPKKPMVILVHGLGGQMNDVLQYMSARIFEKKGFSSFRFNFCGASSRTRKGSDLSLAMNGRDINTVLACAQKKLGAKKIFVAAHSFGFPSLLKSDLTGISAVASWDGSIIPEYLMKNLTPLSELKGYLFPSAYSFFVGKEIISEAKIVSYEHLFKDYTIPTLFAVSKKGKSFFDEEAKKMFPLAEGPKEIVFFENARHGYSEEGAIEALCKKTIEWFNKF